MNDSIYRFRSTHALLDDFSELKNQEIYFASPSELNDPLEGYKDLSWKGDEIAWRNLLRHYLLCLMQAMLRTLEHGPDYQVTSETLPVRMIDEDLQTEVRKVFDSLCERFFGDLELAPLPSLLAHRSVCTFKANCFRCCSLFTLGHLGSCAPPFSRSDRSTPLTRVSGLGVSASFGLRSRSLRSKP
jgi:hypothetical protein